MRRAFTVTQTVILAAGTGSRLGLVRGVPKPLVPVGGVPLIGHALAHARASGCREAIVVVGHEQRQVRAAVDAVAGGMRIIFVESLDPSAPNGVSLLSAEGAAAPSFFLQMVDHLFAGIVLPKLVESPLQPGEAGRVLIDRAPGNLDLDDATKVTLAGTRVQAIGKGLPVWDAIDAGCFVLTHNVFDALRRVAGTEPRTVSSGMRQLVHEHALGAVDVGGVEWIDVDTPRDLDVADRLLSSVAVADGLEPVELQSEP